MQIRKLSEHIGAEITDIDLREPIGQATAEALMNAVVENIAIVIRDQNLAVDEFVAFGGIFGELMSQNQALPGWPTVRQISNKNQKTASGATVTKVQGAEWHTDQTNLERPPKFTILHAIELPDTGGGTSVVNSRAAYEALPDDLKRRVAGLKTLNVFSGSATKDPNPVMLEAQHAANAAGVQAIEHPLVRVHPETGTPALWFHMKKTECIVGMSPQESRDFLEDLQTYIIKPEFTYVHDWRPGDVLMWDNRASLHCAPSDVPPDQHRFLYRLVVEGERPLSLDDAADTAASAR